MALYTKNYLIIIIYYTNNVRYDVSRFDADNNYVNSAKWDDNDRDARYMEMLYEDGRIDMLNDYAERCYNMHK